jgi:hypothetical protein
MPPAWAKSSGVTTVFMHISPFDDDYETKRSASRGRVAPLDWSIESLSGKTIGEHSRGQFLDRLVRACR